MKVKLVSHGNGRCVIINNGNWLINRQKIWAKSEQQAVRSEFTLNVSPDCFRLQQELKINTRLLLSRHLLRKNVSLTAYTHFNVTMRLWIVFLLSRSIILCIVSQVTNGSPIGVKIASFDVTLFTNVRDEFNENNQIVGARNHILRINSSFAIVDSVKNGPLNDSSCLDGEKNCSHRDQDNTLILFHKDSSGEQKIIACGATNHGMCSAHEYRNFSSFHLIRDPNTKNYISSQNTLAMKLPGPNDDSTRYLFAHQFDSGTDTSIPSNALSIRQFFTHPGTKEVHTKLESSLQVKNNWKGRFGFVASFHDDKFIYIVSNRKDEDDHLFGYHARIGRICINDTTLNSYKEVAVVCRTADLSFNYTIATAAHAIRGSKSLKKIYIAFSSSGSKKESAICYYDLDYLALDERAKECIFEPHPAFVGESRHSELPFVDHCSQWREKNRTEYCSRKGHIPMWAKSERDQIYSQIHLENATITSLFTYEEANSSLALIGTSDGVITKVDTSKWIDLVNLYSGNPPSSKAEGIHPDMVLSANEQFAFFSVANKIVRFPIKSCSIYSRCLSCIRTPDPLGCGWCGSYCGAVSECPQGTKNTCSPLINSFTSEIREETALITINGDNFGHGENLNVSWVSISGKSGTCAIKSVKYRKITCAIDGNTEGLNGSRFEVKVKNGSDSPSTSGFIDGTVLSDDRIYFFRPSINNIEPEFGLKSSSIRININGSFLDILDHLKSVKIVSKDNYSVECLVKVFNETNIECDTQTSVNSFIGTIRFLLGNSEYHSNVTFELMNDPVVEEILPSTVDLSSNEPIRVIGKNLNSITKPVLKDGNFSVPCTVKGAKEIICHPPKIDLPKGWRYFRAVLTNNGQELGHQIFNLTLVRSLAFGPPKTEKFSSLYFVLFAIIACVLLSLFGLLLKRNYSKLAATSNSAVDNEKAAHFHGLINQPKIDDEIINTLKEVKMLIPCNYLRKGTRIGAGHFGNVFLGQLQLPGESSSRQVAIKSLRDMNTDSLSEFLEEAYKMKDFDHPNVMGLIGICFQGEKPLLVLPYMPNGDLLKFVRDCDKEHKLIDLLKHCLSIAQGMQYLALKKCVHRDLAARNCMLDKNLNAVVADFGLSKDVYETGYYRRPEGKEPPKLPWRWMAPESMQAFTFSLQSDVWSYGVTCWELLTGGTVPYYGVNDCDLGSYLADGRRLILPRFCPPRVSELWEKCWSLDPRMRPKFTQIVNQLSEFISTETDILEQKVLLDPFLPRP